MDINGPKIGLWLDMKGKPGINLGQPLNIRGILSWSVNDPIILNNKVLEIPITVGVKVQKRKKGKLDINIQKVDIKGPKIDGGINIIGPKVGLPNII